MKKIGQRIRTHNSQKSKPEPVPPLCSALGILCKDPTYAQIRSHSDIPGVLTSTYEFGGDTSQPVTVGILRSGHLPPSRQPTSLAESMWIMACRKKERAHNCVNCHNTTSAINMPWEQRAKALIAHNWA